MDLYHQPSITLLDKMFEQFTPRQVEVLADYADLIPGCLEALEDFRKRGLKIGSTTGYLPAMMEVVVKDTFSQPDCMMVQLWQ